ncbi:MAG: metallophosphoesterase [Burkholderiales bacterium]|nr:metallophosphoesterase [Burkholderiales bacterium]
MRVLVTSDLHYNVAGSREPTRRLASEVCRADADALIIAGDTCGHDLAVMDEALALFESFRGARMLVAGNHCLWVQAGQSSRHRYESEIADAARRRGFHYLDREPVILNNVAFVGNIGWYDYAFASESLSIPRRFYERKVAPGAALMLPEHHDLLRDRHDIRPDLLEIRTRWTDGLHVKLGCTDPDFTRQLADKLAGHLRDVRDRVDHIVVAMHHLPFVELVVRRNRPDWDFANGFMGSPVFGDILLAEPKVRYCICGHTHVPVQVQLGGIRCMTVGSTYYDKRYELLEVRSHGCHDQQ